MGSGLTKKAWLRDHYLTSNRADESDLESKKYSDIYPVWSIAVTSNQKQLASATTERTNDSDSGMVYNCIVLWCLVRHWKLCSLVGHGDTVWKVAYTPDDSLLA